MQRELRGIDATAAFIVPRRGIAREHESHVEAGQVAGESAQFVDKAQFLATSRPIQQGHRHRHAAFRERAGHRQQRRDPAAGGEEQQGRIGSCRQRHLAEGRADVQPGADRRVIAQMLAQLAACHPLHGDRDAAVRARDAGRAVAATDAPTVDFGPDADVLSGLEPAPTAAGLQDQGDRVGRFPAALDHLRPPRIRAGQQAVGPEPQRLRRGHDLGNPFQEAGGGARTDLECSVHGGQYTRECTYVYTVVH